MNKLRVLLVDDHAVIREGLCSLINAQAVSRRDHNDIDRDVKLYFAVANAAMDAFIAAWEAKRYYDSSRP